MGFFDSKWTVYYEYSNGILSSYKKASIVVEASSEYSAKDKAKGVLKANYKYVRILSAEKADSRAKVTKISKPTVTTVSHDAPTREESVHSSPRISRPIVIEKDERTEKEKKIANKEKQIKKIKFSPYLTIILGGCLSLLGFLFGWIPHWYWLVAKQSHLNAIMFYQDLGYDANHPYVIEEYEAGMHAKEMANSVIWIPFVVLLVCLAISALIFVLVKKNSKTKLVRATSELEELEREE